MFKDLRHGLRTLLHAKGWTAVVVLSLALGIGANTAIFSALNGLLLTKVPVADPDSLVRLRWVGRNDMMTSSSDYGPRNRAAYGGQNVQTTFSYAMFRQFAADNRTMTDLFACAPLGRVNLVVDGRADIAQAFVSSGNYYQVLGIGARIGRTIVPDDDRPGAPPVAVISSKYWHTRFGTDPQVVGKVVRVNRLPVTIVGVLPPEFTGVQQTMAEAPDISLPVTLQPQIDAGNGENQLAQPTNWWLQVMGRLKPGATPAQVQGNLEGAFQSTARAGLDSYMKGLSETDRSTGRNRDRTGVPRLAAEPGARGIYDVTLMELRAATIISTIVGLVLLIVCANVANLLLSRAASRGKEISVRLSLGATRGRLIRQLLTESLLLACTGGALGTIVAYWARALLPGLPGQQPLLDWHVLGFTAAVTVLTGIVFGLVPALRGTAVDVNAGLKETSRGVVGTRSVIGRALLVGQVAISLVLLVGAGLFLQTLSNLRRVDVGFDPRNLLLFRVNPAISGYDEPRMRTLLGDLLDRLPQVPGVRGAALSMPALLSGSVNSTGIFVQGRAYPEGRGHEVNRLVISPNFFDVMGIAMVAGRSLTDRDEANAPKAAVINEAAARKYFAGENPVGKRFGLNPAATGEIEIVGVLRDAKYNSVRDPAPPTMYLSFRQQRTASAVFAVRTSAAPSSAAGAVREAVRQIDPNLPVIDVSTQLEMVERRFEMERMFARANALFGGLALLLAAIGLFGLMSYNVSRRTSEIGIRMALGAQRGDVLGMVLRESMLLVGIGVAAGLAAAIAAGRFVAAFLFGLEPRDPATIAVATAVMIAVAALAGYLPARRASRVDPMVALRYE
jgi:predicted permease